MRVEISDHAIDRYIERVPFAVKLTRDDIRIILTDAASRAKRAKGHWRGMGLAMVFQQRHDRRGLVRLVVTVWPIDVLDHAGDVTRLHSG